MFVFINKDKRLKVKENLSMIEPKIFQLALPLNFAGYIDAITNGKFKQQVLDIMAVLKNWLKNILNLILIWQYD